MGIKINKTLYEKREHIQNLFESNPFLGWDNQWNEITEQLLAKDKVFENVKYLEIELIRQQGIKEKFSDKYISDIYLKFIRKEIAYYLEEMTEICSHDMQVAFEKIVQDVTKMYMQKSVSLSAFINEINEIRTYFGNINIYVKKGKSDHIAETRVREKVKVKGKTKYLSPADIDIYRVYLPSMNYRWKEESFRDNIGKRIFTIVHELTHCVLGKLDKTKSASVNIFNPNTFILGDRVVNNNSVLINNADSWAISFFKIKDELMQVKGQQGQPEE